LNARPHSPCFDSNGWQPIGVMALATAMAFPGMGACPMRPGRIASTADCVSSYVWNPDVPARVMRMRSVPGIGSHWVMESTISLMVRLVSLDARLYGRERRAPEGV